MKRMQCYNYLNYATTCDQLYKFVRHLQRAHGQIPSRIAINRAPRAASQMTSKSNNYQAVQPDLCAYGARR